MLGEYMAAEMFKSWAILILEYNDNKLLSLIYWEKKSMI